MTPIPLPGTPDHSALAWWTSLGYTPERDTFYSPWMVQVGRHRIHAHRHVQEINRLLLEGLSLEEAVTVVLVGETL